MLYFARLVFCYYRMLCVVGGDPPPVYPRRRESAMPDRTVLRPVFVLWQSAFAQRFFAVATATLCKHNIRKDIFLPRFFALRRKFFPSGGRNAFVFRKTRVLTPSVSGGAGGAGAYHSNRPEQGSKSIAAAVPRKSKKQERKHLRHGGAIRYSLGAFSGQERRAVWRADCPPRCCAFLAVEVLAVEGSQLHRL